MLGLFCWLFVYSPYRLRRCILFQSNMEARKKYIIMNDYYNWFEEYTNHYLQCKDLETRVNYELKKEHTLRVKDNILDIGRSLNLCRDELRICELIGLFHDIGRFRQYDEYGTFSDSISGSHAALSIEVLINNGILNDLSETDKDIILKAIGYHNYFLVPEEESDTIKLFSRSIRDADKLDAFFLETNNNEQRKYDLGELSTEREYSEEIIEDIMNSRQVNFKNIKYKYDRRLGILGLIFDLFYNESYIVFQEANYLSRMFSNLPDNKEMKKLYNHCEDCISRRIKSIRSY